MKVKVALSVSWSNFSKFHSKMTRHMERLVREVAASAFSSTIGDVRLVFQGGQQVIV